MRGGDRRIPYVYLYAGGSIGSDMDNLISNLISNPSALTNPKNLLMKGSFSISVFAIFGLGNFYSAENYKGPVSEITATVWHGKGYVAFGSSCATVGIGWSTDVFSASQSVVYYNYANKYLPDFFNALAQTAQDLTAGMSLP